MKNKILTCIFLFISAFSLGQEIDLEKIKNNTQDKDSKYYYDKLVEEFIQSNQSLLADKEKLQNLYYGKLFSPYYKESSEMKSDYLKFMKLVGAKKIKKYPKAIELGENILKKDPINLMVIMNLRNSYTNTKDNENRLKELKSQSELLMSAIAASGDGTSKETAFKVITLADEITLLNYLGINMGKYNRNSKIINKYTVLDLWTKHNNYNEEHRDQIFIEVFNNGNKIKL